jgi:hypothetical protein
MDDAAARPDSSGKISDRRLAILCHEEKDVSGAFHGNRGCVAPGAAIY